MAITSTNSRPMRQAQRPMSRITAHSWQQRESARQQMENDRQREHDRQQREQQRLRRLLGLIRLSQVATISAQRPDEKRVKEVAAGCTECAICLVEYSSDEDGVSLKRCGHRFHQVCVDRWLEKDRRCPLCRRAT